MSTIGDCSTCPRRRVPLPFPRARQCASCALAAITDNEADHRARMRERGDSGPDEGNAEDATR